MTQTELINRLATGSHYCEKCEAWIAGKDVEYLSPIYSCKICGFELLPWVTLNFFREEAGRLAER
jgi:hypothetical protein